MNRIAFKKGSRESTHESPSDGGCPEVQGVPSEKAKNRRARNWFPVVFCLTFLFLTNVFFSHLDPLQKNGILKLALNKGSIVLSLVALLFFFWRAIQFWLKGFRGRAVLLVVLAVLFYILYKTKSDPFEALHLVVYFLLGFFFYQTLRERSLSIRVWLNVLFYFWAVIFTDGVIQGLLPDHEYSMSGIRIIPIFIMAFLGFFIGCLRYSDTDIRSLFRRRKKRNYRGKPPLLDLHFYGRDFLYPLFSFLLLGLNMLIVVFYDQNDLSGRWTITGNPYPVVVLLRDGPVQFETERGRKKLGWYTIQGNLLDGFFLWIGPEPDCDVETRKTLKHFLERWRRFRKKGDFLVFDDESKDWMWCAWTVLKVGGDAYTQTLWKNSK